PLDLDHRPAVVLMLGVNGAGKTTTAAKLAAALRGSGKQVLLAAADTFRAAAIEQLQTWGERIGVEVIHQAPGSDPAAVVFDAVKAAAARRVDVLLIDTAGRLHTKSNFMDELIKLKRVAERQLAGAPHESLMVLDAPTGQNGFAQAAMFHHSIGLTGLCLSKLDGTAKGGIVVRIVRAAACPSGRARELERSEAPERAGEAREPASSMTDDERFMLRALDVAACARGLTSPNPMVGAVVVREGTMIAEGLHRAAGEPH